MLWVWITYRQGAFFDNYRDGWNSMPPVVNDRSSAIAEISNGKHVNRLD